MTGIKKKGFSFTWKIENFSFYYQESIGSPYFPDENFDQSHWQLVLFPKDDPSHDDSVSNVYFELWLVEEEREIVIDFKIEIIGPGGHLLGVYEEKNVVFNEGNLSRGGNLVETAIVKHDIFRVNKDFLTVCCHISSTESSVANSPDCLARTKIIVNQLNLRLTWEKNEINALLDMKNQSIMKKLFYFSDMIEWCITFKKMIEDVQIRIDRCDNDSPQYIDCKISLLDAKGNQIFSIKDKNIFSKDNNEWVMPSFFPVSEIKHNRNKYIKNGRMLILCELFCSGCIESQAVIHENSERKMLVDDTDISLHTVQSDIRNLFSDKTLCDVKIRVEDEIVQAHKSILAARSPVFHAMFQLDMVEAKTGIVDIQDVDIDTFKAFMNYIYCDIVDKMDYDGAKNLLIVAEKYEVLRLKEMCGSFLKSEISDRNACEIAALADMVSHKGLKSFAIDFIADHSKNILIMPEWVPWIKNHMELATEIFQRLSEKHILT
ncbi:speckle-type POZ protein B [Parasteatoda tepidariorum]|uniref:speckle-type POZ protein B n=1 Tax=Parasteatoda tepidariorum TaxID=114398 RepID=UPI00077FCB8F|nr:speckle-type POZ protein B [Parasteatoda tepidariorum]